MLLANIESLDHEGRGVAHVDGKAIFVEGALPGEIVEYASYRRKRSYEKAHAVSVLRPSSQRVAPQRLLELGFRFRFPALADALGDLCRRVEAATPA